jgi:ketopantoate reductase
MGIINLKSEDFKSYYREYIMNKQPYHSIKCTVTSCANHAKKENYCVLDTVMIGTHETNPTVSQCVDCESFVLGNCGGDSCRTTK